MNPSFNGAQGQVWEMQAASCILSVDAPSTALQGWPSGRRDRQSSNEKAL